MAGLLLGGCLALRHGGLTLALSKGSLEHEQRATTSALAVAAACDNLTRAGDGTGPVGGCGGGGALLTVLAVGTPPRTHTRRLVVPAYALSGTRTRRRRGGRGGGDDEDPPFGGGGDDGGWGGGDFWGGDEGEEEGDGSAARLQDLLLLWTLFCAAAFAQTVYHVSPKPKPAGPAFAALSYASLKAHLRQRQAPAAA